MVPITKQHTHHFRISLYCTFFFWKNIYLIHKPRCEIRVAKDCQNRPNLKVFFKASKWLDMLRTSMTTIASTFVLQKKSFFSFFPLIFKQTVKKEEFRLTNTKTSITRQDISKLNPNFYFNFTCVEKSINFNIFLTTNTHQD